MKLQIAFITSLVLIISGCKQNKFDDALGEITQSSKDLTKCHYEERLKETDKCSRLNYEIAVDKANVIGINESRINAASNLGMRLYESENSELVSKVKAEVSAKEAKEAKEAAIIAKEVARRDAAGLCIDADMSPPADAFVCDDK